MLLGRSLREDERTDLALWKHSPQSQSEYSQCFSERRIISRQLLRIYLTKSKRLEQCPILKVMAVPRKVADALKSSAVDGS